MNEQEEIKEEDIFVEVMPAIFADHNEENYHIEIELPGVKKEDIDLVMGGESFCLKAQKGDMVYSACYSLAHLIDTSKTKANFDNGMLIITAPFVHPIKGVKIEIE